MRVHYFGEKFISIDEIPEVYDVDVNKNFFGNIPAYEKFVLVKGELYNKVMSVVKKIHIDATNATVNSILIITSGMLDEKLLESEILGFLESDFNKFITISYLDTHYMRRN